MKRVLLKSLSLLAVFFQSLPFMAQSYEAQWKEVERLQKDALPASVIRAVDKIYVRAEREGNFSQMLKAYLTRMQARRAISPDSAYVDVSRLDTWGQREKNPVRRSLLRMVLGNAYDELGRRAPYVETADAPLSDDLSKWTHTDFDKARRVAYTEALADMSLLAGSEVGDYAVLVEKGEESALYGHDLLSLIVREVASRCTGSVDFDYMSDIYAHAVDCYQKLHRSDAACMMQLARLRFLNERNSPEGNPLWRNREAYTDSIKKLLASHASMAPYIYQEWADMESNDSVQYALCREALTKYPRYKFADYFRMRLDVLTSPQLSFSLEGMLLQGRPLELRVTHRSVPNVRVRVKESLSGKVLETKTFRLPTDVPYEVADTVLSLNPLPRAGRYVVEMQAGKETRKLELNHCYLRPVARRLPDGRWQVLVLDNLTGHPVEGAEVEWMKQDRSDRKPVYVSLGKARSGRSGDVFFHVDSYDCYLCAAKSNYGRTDTLRCYDYNYTARVSTSDDVDYTTYLYTDRAVYRPGQAIQISGLTFSGDKEKYQVCEGRKIELEVTDANDNTLAELTVTTNEMGSFSTQVALPENCMPGTVDISCNDASTTCRVEEYKRPVFEVELKPLEVAYALGDSVTLEGTALNYTGTPVAGGEVQYTVTRARRWMVVRGQQPELTVAAGKTTVDAEGHFQVPFRLVSNVSSDDEYAWQSFVVAVSVTSPAGETQEAFHTVSAGSKSLDLGHTSNTLYIKERLDSLMLTAYNNERRMVGVDVELSICPLSYDGKQKIQVGEPLYTGRFRSGKMFFPEMLEGLPSGWYRMCLKASDDQGRESEGQSDFTLFSMNDNRIPVKEALWTYQDSHRFEEGNPVTLKIGTAESDVCLFYDVFSSGKHLESKHFILNDTLLTLRLENRPEYAEGVLVQCLVVKEGSVYEQSLTISPVEKKRDLQLRWETFRDRLRPGDREEWRLRVTLPDGTPADAELLATMYDKSLDKYQRLYWPIGVPGFSRLPYVNLLYPRTSPANRYFSLSSGKKYRNICWHFDEWIQLMRFRGLEVMQASVVGYAPSTRKALTGAVNGIDVADMKSANALDEVVTLSEPPVKLKVQEGTNEGGTQAEMRTNFAETAFFYPHIRTDSTGIATLAFTLPESLTTWRFMGLAHTRDMYYGLLEDEVVASKEFMLQSQLPRFVRVGDEATLSASIENRSDKPVKGHVRMELFDPQTEKVYVARKQSFEVAAGESTVASFKVTFEETALLACRIIADGDNFSDGEQRYLPVLSNKEWLTESQTITIKKAGHYEADLTTLFNKNSRTATKRHLTVEYTNHPAWLAVMALPSLGQPKNDDAISLASAYYALSLGGWVAKAYPRIQEVCRAWQAQGGNAETLWSQLQKNPELKNIVLEETPWLDEANDEAEQRRMLATLFDLNTLQARTTVYLNKLAELQRPDGGWSWYPGMSGSRYVTTTVVETLLRLNHLTDGEFDSEVGAYVSRGMDYLAEDMMEEYKRVKEAEKDGGAKSVPSEMTLHYLYLQALCGTELPADKQAAVNYYLDRLEHLSSDLTIFGKAASAYVLNQAGRQDAGRTFLQSCLEYAVQTPEMGRYYDTDIAYYSWADYRIPTQTMVIETCRALGVPDSIVGEYQQWLLRQKQVQAWSTPIGSVNAVYALLEGRGEWLAASEPATLKLDKQEVASEGAATALGYVKQTVSLRDGEKAPKKLVVDQQADHLSWGAVYAQYLEELDKVSSQSSGLSIERHLLVRRLSDGKEEWQEVKPGDVLSVGDRVLSRLIIRADRDMDFVQVEDKPAACMEPGVALSGYRWDDGIGYYRVIKDASVRYFADQFRKGVHTFTMEYTLTAAGTYSLGIATIQSAYAPELNAHSAADVIRVK